MVPANVLTRVFSIRTGPEQGTGFTIEVDGRQYLITARHLATALVSSHKLEVFHDSTWTELPFRVVTVAPTNVDIAVLALNQQLSGLLPIQLGIKDSFLSQDVYFVGFPYRLSIPGQALNNGFPLPLVKHGVIASVAVGAKGEPFLIDGINNPGMSGGPVVISPGGSATPTIIGVVSAYQAAQEPVYKADRKTDLSVKANTGLLVAFSIDYALDAIAVNPIGFQVAHAP